MECRDVRELADSFLTGQLLVETNHEMVQHLERCPTCRAYIAERRLLREKLRSALDRSEDLRPRPEFAAELAAALAPRSATMTRRSLLRSWWSLAAGVVVAAGGGVFVQRSRTRSQHLVTLAREAAGDHANCAIHFNLQERPIAMDEAGRRYGAPYAALASVELPSPLNVFERHACVYEGLRFGHVVFRYRDAVVSLLVVNDAAPARPQLEASEDGYAVASLPAGRFLGFIVSDLDRSDVLDVARSISGALARQLV